MTFRTGWDNWTTQLAPTMERDDGDKFFGDGSKQIFKFDNFEKMMKVCPIATSFPLETPLAGRQLLARGTLAGRFALHPTHYNINFYRTLRSVWTSSYDEGMRELFPPAQSPRQCPWSPRSHSRCRPT
jgi:hypothetical protein